MKVCQNCYDFLGDVVEEGEDVPEALEGFEIVPDGDCEMCTE